MMTAILWITVLVLLLVCAGGGAYFLVIVPKRWRWPLDQALELIDSDDRDQLERADRLLAEALNAGPRGKALADARFAQAFVRATLGRYEPGRYGAAVTAVEELTTAEGYDGATAYLALWLHARLENHEKVCELFDVHGDLLAPMASSRRIAAVSHFQLAIDHWRRREIDGALHYFDRLRELGQLTDQIPPGVENLQLVQGIQAVFDDRMEDARSCFAGARERASQRGDRTVEAELGILACEWRSGEPTELAERLERLAAILRRLPPEDAEGELLKAPVALLRLVALLREWTQRPALSGILSEADRDELARRADAVREADGELGDADLVTGLLGYYFALGQDEREEALAALERGRDAAKGIMLPEVLDLVERERALGGEGDAVTRYLQLLGEFLADPERSAQDRARYLRLRSRFARFSDTAGVEDRAEPPRQVTLDDSRRRGEALRRRIELIVYPRLRDRPEDDPARLGVQELVAKLVSANDTYAGGVAGLHGAERELVALAGEFLLPEENHEGPHS